MLLSEAAETIASALEIAVAAASPSLALGEVLALRRAGRAQLDVAGKLLYAVRYRRADNDHSGAAAAGSSDLAEVAPLALSEVDVRSDEPGFASPMPGTADVTHGDSYTQGSTGSVRPASGELGQAPVSADPFVSAQGPRPMTEQGYASTADGSDPFRDPISGVVTPPAVVAGAKVAGPHHPNAESGGGR
jgi:hypothetical protein